MFFADEKELIKTSEKLKNKYPSLQIQINETDNTLTLISKSLNLDLIGYDFITDMIIINDLHREIDIDNMINIIKVQKVFVESLK